MNLNVPLSEGEIDKIKEKMLEYRNCSVSEYVSNLIRRDIGLA